MEGCSFWVSHSSCGFHLPYIAHLFLFWEKKDFVLLFNVDDILVLVLSELLVTGHNLLFIFLVCLQICINFSKSELSVTEYFCCRGLFEDTVDMSVSLPTDKLLETHQFAFSLLQMHFLQSMRSCLFMGKANFVPLDMHNFVICDRMTLYDSLAYLLHILHLFSWLCINLEIVSVRTVPSFLLSHAVIIAVDDASSQWSFHFWVQVYSYHSVEPAQLLREMFTQLYRIYR